jgi:hypothetical protein
MNADDPEEIAKSALDDAKHLAGLSKGCDEPLRGIMEAQFFVLTGKLEYLIETLAK